MGRTFASSNMAITLALIAGMVPPFALAEGETVKLSKEDLASLLPGTKAVYVIKAGSIHRWTNEPDGKFVASTDAKTVSMSSRSGGTAHGTWRLSDDGKYCINIEWKNVTEDWCSFVFRGSDGGYYLAGSDNPAAEKRRIEFTK